MRPKWYRAKDITPRTRLYDLVKAEAHDKLKNLIEKIRPWVRNEDGIDWKHLRYFEIDEERIKKTEFILIIAEFLSLIGKGDGLKCKMSVFIRYLASNEHSNFCLKYRSLNTLIYRMLAYLEGDKKVGEKL